MAYTQQFEIFLNCSAHPKIAHVMKAHENVIIIVSSCLSFPTGNFFCQLNTFLFVFSSSFIWFWSWNENELMTPFLSLQRLPLSSKNRLVAQCMISE